MCELTSPPPLASPSENGTPHSSGTTTKIHLTSPTGNAICMKVRGIYGQAQKIVINAPSTERNRFDTHRAVINSDGCFSDTSVNNLGHLNSRSTDKFTLANTGQQTPDGFFKPVSKPRSGY